MSITNDQLDECIAYVKAQSRKNIAAGHYGDWIQDGMLSLRGPAAVELYEHVRSGRDAAAVEMLKKAFVYTYGTAATEYAREQEQINRRGAMIEVQENTKCVGESA